MKSSYKVLISEKLVLRKYRGDASLEAMRALFEETEELRNSYPDFRAVNDFRGVSLLFDKNDFVHLMASYTSSNFFVSQKIFIIDSPAFFVLYNFFKDYYHFKNIQIFNTLEAACHSNNMPLSILKKSLD